MPARDIEANHLGDIRHECVDGYLPVYDTDSNAMEVELATIQEDSCNFGAFCWCSDHHLCNAEEYLCHRCKYSSWPISAPETAIQKAHCHEDLSRYITDSRQDPVNGGAHAAEWGTRETFIAVVTTNLPMIFPLFKVWLQPFLPSTLRSSSNKAYKTPGSGFVTIGGGEASSHANKTPRSGTRISANMTFDNESEERMFKADDVRMQHLQSPTQQHQAGIIVSKQVSVTTEPFGKNGSSRQV